MPSAPEFHPYVGYLGGSKRRYLSARAVLAATLIGALAGGGAVLALMPSAVTTANKGSPATLASASAERSVIPSPSGAAERSTSGEATSAKDNVARTATADTFSNVANKGANPTNKTAGTADASAAARGEKPCAEQTWPYLDRKCLSQSDSKTKSRGTRVVAPGATTNTTELAGGPAEPATDGASSAASGPPAAAQTVSADVPAPRPRPEVESGASDDNSDTQQAHNETAEAEQKPAKSAERRVSSARKKKASRSQYASRRRGSEEARNRSFDDQARGRYSDYEDDQNPRVARRWSEREVTFPDGRRQRVIVIRRGGSPFEAFRDRNSREAYRDPYPRDSYRAYARESFFGGW